MPTTHGVITLVARLSPLCLTDFNRVNIPPPHPPPSVQASGFTRDKLKPSLQSYSLDMNSGIMNLSFSEPVNISTLQPQGFSLQDLSNRASGKATHYDLVAAGVQIVHGVGVNDWPRGSQCARVGCLARRPHARFHVARGFHVTRVCGAPLTARGQSAWSSACIWGRPI